jgi:hypothetical protein
MNRIPLAVFLAALALSCKDPRAVQIEAEITGTDRATLAPPAAPGSAMPAAPPGIGGPGQAGGAGAGLTCPQLAPKPLLDALTGLQTNVRSVTEAAPPDKGILRCENRTSDIEQHFGYYVECGKPARKAFTQLRKQMRKMARNRKGQWKSGFEAPGTFAFLSKSRRCYAQVAGRLLLRRPDLGERIGAELARNLYQ